MHYSLNVYVYIFIKQIKYFSTSNLDTASLRRGNSFFTRCIETMIRSSCKPFLVLSLKELVTEISCLKTVAGVAILRPYKTFGREYQ